MEPLFKRYNPASPFIYRFVDDDYAAKFAAEQRIGSLAATLTALAIFISCLGLFGLAAFVAEQRTKEIGVRKVLGAGTLSLWSLLSVDFIKLTAISMLVAMPLAWWTMHQWLAHFAYRVGVSWWVIALSAGGMVLIALLTLCIQAIRAAIANPLRSLRSE